ncbi:ribonuclease domain-containing protein [Solilutibacter silvestris]|uniref:ribonuclease domain-containing protein n=1 Tax=Solilutibacter silvestris TaxID=1645665 RepID=UPI003D333E71
MNTPNPNRRPIWPWLAILALLFFAMWWHRSHGGGSTAVIAQQSTSLPGRTTAESHPLPPLSGRSHDSAGATAANAGLPPEARDTLRLIAQGGPFPYRQDGVVFGNREGRLPDHPYGYYHEYTVVTPGAPTRGTRRIITGGTPPQVWYYTDDHYRSFRRIDPSSS